MDSLLLLVIIMLFVAVFLVVERVLALTVGPQRAEAKRFKKRLQFVSESQHVGAAASLIRDAGIEKQSRFERWLGSWPGLGTIQRRLRAAGYKLTLAQVLMISLGAGLLGFGVSWYLGRILLGVIVGLLVTTALPIKITIDYKKRLYRFEEGMIEALDVMIRSLRAGLPFNESMLTIAQELEGPVADEFGLTFAELNYGLSPQEAFAHMLERVPSVTLKALVVAVLLQRETGGNLAELLEKISVVLRGRFKFQRKLKTLSAEGRLSAIILISVPFVLFGMIYVTTPSYLAALMHNPQGNVLIAVSAVLMIIGIIWVRKLTRIDV